MNKKDILNEYKKKIQLLNNTIKDTTIIINQLLVMQNTINLNLK
jgi:hypothetical protein